MWNYNLYKLKNLTFYHKIDELKKKTKKNMADTNKKKNIGSK